MIALSAGVSVVVIAVLWGQNPDEFELDYAGVDLKAARRPPQE